MKILILAKLDENDRIVQDFSDKFLQKDVDIHLLNAINIPSEIPLKINGEIIDVCTEYNLTKYYDQQKLNLSKLNTYLSNLNVVQRNTFIGNPLQIVKWYIKENNIDLVISGGHLTTQMEDIFSSSFAEHLLRSLAVPYLSIKGDSSKIKNIAIVREFIDPSKRNLDLIKKMQDQFGAKIIFVKINIPNNSIDAEELQQKMQLFAELNDLKNVEFLTINASLKESAIKDLIRDQKIDLLSLDHIHRDGISSFLRGDLRSDILNHVNIPIYVY